MKKNHESYLNSYLKNLSHSTPQEIDYVRPYLKIKEYRKRDFFLKRGDVQKEMGFISVGLVRRYYINEKGNQITTGFAKENEYLTDYPAFIKQRPTKYFLQCIEPSVIIGVPYSIIQLSYEKFTNGQLYGRLMAEQTLTILNDRIEGFLFNTAEERYLKFVKKHPELMNRVSLTHLSSFLGIERQSLSRIRKRITKK